MILIPAIDIKDNNCVRLKKGNIKKIKIFSKNVLTVINKWINLNIKRIHLVDLNKAISEKSKNLISIKTILKYCNNCIEIEIGGGIRDLDIIEYYFEIGISYVILGTKAIMDLNFFKNVCEKYGKKIILALDLKNLKLAINGWKKYYNMNLTKFLNEIKSYNFSSFIYTDTIRDGTLKGLNIENFLKIKKYIDKPIIISGGLNSKKEIKEIFSIQDKKLLGIICGTSIYLGKINLKNINSKLNYFNKFNVF